MRFYIYIYTYIYIYIKICKTQKYIFLSFIGYWQIARDQTLLGSL